MFGIHQRAAKLDIDYVEVQRARIRSITAPGPTLRHVVRSRNIDIVHAHDYKTDLLALGAGSLRAGHPAGDGARLDRPQPRGSGGSTIPLTS